MDSLFLTAVFERAWLGKDPFEEVRKLQGSVFRQVKGRRMLRFEMDGLAYFAKIHEGVGWAEIFKNLLQGKWPVLGADPEWRAIQHLHAAGVPTMTVSAFGSRGANPARRRSFIVTEELADRVSLETLTRPWRHQPPSHRLKVALIEKVAAMARQMHASGMNHRDFYLCHFLADMSKGWPPADPGGPDLVLIDLHRAQIRASTPRRWIVKDLGGLYFSAMDIGLTRTDLIRFRRAYERALPLAGGLATWQAAARRAVRMARYLGSGQQPPNRDNTQTAHPLP